METPGMPPLLRASWAQSPSQAHPTSHLPHLPPLLEFCAHHLSKHHTDHVPQAPPLLTLAFGPWAQTLCYCLPCDCPALAACLPSWGLAPHPPEHSIPAAPGQAVIASLRCAATPSGSNAVSPQRATCPDISQITHLTRHLAEGSERPQPQMGTPGVTGETTSRTCLTSTGLWLGRSSGDRAQHSPGRLGPTCPSPVHKASPHSTALRSVSAALQGTGVPGTRAGPGERYVSGTCT